MSDFDKEAEREKLREKYEREAADRQSTQQMSELLLQGATMTNRHCDECGNPIFRYDGQEFCANCQQADEQAAAEDDGTGEADEGTPRESTEMATEFADGAQEPSAAGSRANAEEEPRTGGRETAETAADPPSGREADRTDTPAAADRRNAGTEPPTAVDRDGPAAGGRVRDRVEGGSERRDPPSAEWTAGPREGEAALLRALTKFADRAEATDDPREAREYLAAAREAAEALSALRR